MSGMGSGVATGGGGTGPGGQSVIPDSEKFAKIRKKRKKTGKIGEKEEKSGREGKNQKGYFTLPLLTDRAGYTTRHGLTVSRGPRAKRGLKQNEVRKDLGKERIGMIYNTIFTLLQAMLFKYIKRPEP